MPKQLYSLEMIWNTSRRMFQFSKAPNRGDLLSHPTGYSSAELSRFPESSVIQDVCCHFTCPVGSLEPGNHGNDWCFEAQLDHHICLGKARGRRPKCWCSVFRISFFNREGKLCCFLVFFFFLSPFKISLSVSVFFKTTDFDNWFVVVTVFWPAV